MAGVVVNLLWLLWIWLYEQIHSAGHHVDIHQNQFCVTVQLGETELFHVISDINYERRSFVHERRHPQRHRRGKE